MRDGGGSRSSFPFGVASGDPTTSAVTIWTSTSSDVRTVTWWLRDPVDGRTRRGTIEPSDGFVTVRVDGLAPGRELTYGFEAGRNRSSVGHTRTLADAPNTVRVAVVCCSRWPDGPFDVYRRVVDAAPDLVLHLGDYLYQDGAGGPRGPHQPPRSCRSADDYQTRYAQYRSDPDLQALHEAVPWLAIWDDHEFADDAWRFGSRDMQSSQRWQRRRRAAAEAFARWMPQRSAGDGPTSVDRRVTFGSLADLIAVDCRIAGRERPKGDADGPTVEPERDRRLLTEAQWEWLDACLAEATGAWLILATSVQFSPLRLLPVPSRRWPPVRWMINPDQWDGYPGERRRLLELLGRHDRLDTLVLSGDLHGRFHSRWSHGEATVNEVTTPSVTAPTFSELLRGAVGPVPPRLLSTWLRLVNPHIDHLDLTTHGATLLSISDRGIEVTPITAGGTGPAFQLR